MTDTTAGAADDVTYENWIRQELRFGKSAYVPWGREVIRAIDLNDCVTMYQSFKTKQVLGADKDVKVTTYGYGGHMWSPWMHNFLGDTAMHLSFKQRKWLCVYLLLVIRADCNVPNGKGEIVTEMCQQLLNRPIHDLEIEAYRRLVEGAYPKRFHLLPDRLNYRRIGIEAWRLMEAGRMLYTEIPDSFSYAHVRFNPQPLNNYQHPPRPIWRRQHDPAPLTPIDPNDKSKPYERPYSPLGPPYLYNKETGERMELTEQEVKTGHWEVVVDSLGSEYCVNELTGQISRKSLRQVLRDVKKKVIKARRLQLEQVETAEKSLSLVVTSPELQLVPGLAENAVSISEDIPTASIANDSAPIVQATIGNAPAPDHADADSYSDPQQLAKSRSLAMSTITISQAGDENSSGRQQLQAPADATFPGPPDTNPSSISEAGSRKSPEISNGNLKSKRSVLKGISGNVDSSPQSDVDDEVLNDELEANERERTKLQKKTTQQPAFTDTLKLRQTRRITTVKLGAPVAKEDSEDAKRIAQLRLQTHIRLREKQRALKEDIEMEEEELREDGPDDPEDIITLPSVLSQFEEESQKTTDLYQMFSPKVIAQQRLNRAKIAAETKGSTAIEEGFSMLSSSSELATDNQSTMEAADLEACARKGREELVKAIDEKNVVQEAGLRGNQLMRDRLYEARTGVNSTPAAKSMGDCFVKDNITDIIRILKRQQERKRKIQHALFRKSSTLLQSSGDNDGDGGTTDVAIRPDIVKSLDDLQGVKKLKFIKMKTLQEIVYFETAKFPEVVDKANKKTAAAQLRRLKQQREQEKLKMRGELLMEIDYAENAAATAATMKSSAKSESAVSVKASSLKPTKQDAAFTNYPYRYITQISTRTNMKYCNISDDGVEALSDVLKGDTILTSICLGNARISCRGMFFFTKVLPHIALLEYLDLSQNAIADKGVLELCLALPDCVRLKTLSLAGNRITTVGVQYLLNTTLTTTSPLVFLSVCRNRLDETTKQAYRDLVNDFNAEVRHRVASPGSFPLGTGSRSSSLDPGTAGTLPLQLHTEGLSTVTPEPSISSTNSRVRRCNVLRSALDSLASIFVRVFGRRKKKYNGLSGADEDTLAGDRTGDHAKGKVAEYLIQKYFVF